MGRNFFKRNPFSNSKKAKENTSEETAHESTQNSSYDNRGRSDSYVSSGNFDASRASNPTPTRSAGSGYQSVNRDAPAPSVYSSDYVRRSSTSTPSRLNRGSESQFAELSVNDEYDRRSNVVQQRRSDSMQSEAFQQNRSQEVVIRPASTIAFDVSSVQQFDMDSRASNATPRRRSTSTSAGSAVVYTNAAENQSTLSNPTPKRRTYSQSGDSGNAFGQNPGVSINKPVFTNQQAAIQPDDNRRTSTPTPRRRSFSESDVMQSAQFNRERAADQTNNSNPPIITQSNRYYGNENRQAQPQNVAGPQPLQQSFSKTFSSDVSQSGDRSISNPTPRRRVPTTSAPIPTINNYGVQPEVFATPAYGNAPDSYVPEAPPGGYPDPFVPDIPSGGYPDPFVPDIPSGGYPDPFVPDISPVVPPQGSFEQDILRYPDSDPYAPPILPQGNTNQYEPPKETFLPFESYDLPKDFYQPQGSNIELHMFDQQPQPSVRKPNINDQSAQSSVQRGIGQSAGSDGDTESAERVPPTDKRRTFMPQSGFSSGKTFSDLSKKDGSGQGGSAGADDSHRMSNSSSYTRRK